MLRIAFIIAVVHTLCCFAVYADGFAGMLQRTGIRVSPFFAEALTAGILRAACPAASYHDVSLAAALILVIDAAIYCTIQLSHCLTSYFHLPA